MSGVTVGNAGMPQFRAFQIKSARLRGHSCLLEEGSGVACFPATASQAALLLLARSLFLAGLLLTGLFLGLAFSSLFLDLALGYFLLSLLLGLTLGYFLLSLFLGLTLGYFLLSLALGDFLFRLFLGFTLGYFLLSLAFSNLLLDLTLCCLLLRCYFPLLSDFALRSLLT